jgi:MFS family permease
VTSQPPSELPEQRPSTLALASSAITLAVGLGFLVGGALMDSLGYLFLGGVLLGVGSMAALAALVLPQRAGTYVALRLMVVSLVIALFFLAWGPISDAFADQILHAFQTPAPTPSPTPCRPCGL